MNINIGNIIATAIEFKDLKQIEVAKQLGIQYSTFNNYVNNLREPDFETLIKIFKFLDLDLNKTFHLELTNSDFTLTKDEATMLRSYRSLNEKQKKILLRFHNNFVNMLQEEL